MTAKVFLLFTTALLATMVESRTQCRPEDEQFALKYDIIETLLNAPIVVLGSDWAHDEEANVVHLTVKCILKSGVDIPMNISLKDAAVPNSCAGTYFTQGNDYVVCLKKDVDEDLSSKLFTVHEPGEFNAGAWEVTDTVLQKAANLCGVKPREVVENANTCPERTATEADCIDITHIGSGTMIRADMFISFLLLLLLHYIMP